MMLGKLMGRAPRGSATVFSAKELLPLMLLFVEGFRHPNKTAVGYMAGELLLFASITYCICSTLDDTLLLARCFQSRLDAAGLCKELWDSAS